MKNIGIYFIETLVIILIMMFLIEGYGIEMNTAPDYFHLVRRSLIIVFSMIVLTGTSMIIWSYILSNRWEKHATDSKITNK